LRQWFDICKCDRTQEQQGKRRPKFIHIYTTCISAQAIKA
jgi:hypothetical protein